MIEVASFTRDIVKDTAAAFPQFLKKLPYDALAVPPESQETQPLTNTCDFDDRKNDPTDRDDRQDNGLWWRTRVPAVPFIESYHDDEHRRSDVWQCFLVNQPLDILIE